MDMIVIGLLIELAFAPVLTVLESARASAATPPHYAIAAHIEPARGFLEVDVSLSGLDLLPRSSVLYLHRNARILAATLDGHSVGVRLDTTRPPGPYMPHSAALTLPPGDHSVLTLRYVLEVHGMINDVNTIASDLVELALYASWYPVSPSMPRFTYDLTLSLPEGWTVVTNGEPLDSSTAASGQSRWRSVLPGTDVVVLSSPDLRVHLTQRGAIALQVAAPASIIGRLDPVMDYMSAAFDSASSWFGTPGPTGRLCVVFPPRTGWGYSRIPLIVTNLGYGQALAATPAAMPSRLKGVYHELSHFWWQIADSQSDDDWLNEALAEYSAWRLLRQLGGRAAASAAEAVYREDALRPGADVPIVASRVEPGRYINRYEKGALVFIGFERRFGWENTQAMLRAVLAEARAAPITTARFARLCESIVGPSAARYVNDLVQAAGWTPALLSLVPAEG